MKKVNKEKRYFVDVANEVLSKAKGVVIIIFICIFLISLLASYLYQSIINNEAYYETYPEETYEYLETVADNAIQNGAFYKSAIPEDVTFEFLEDGNLELIYNSEEDNSYLHKYITIQLSEKFEIAAKTRNNISADEFDKEMKIARISNVLLNAMVIFAAILLLIEVLLIISIVLSIFYKKHDSKPNT